MMNVFQSYQRCLAWSAVPLLALCVLLAGCEDGELLPPEPEGGDLFARYVTIGNSITAGFQSGGINANTQRDAYSVLLAQQMGLDVGDTFNIPTLNLPGCPPPLTQIFPEPETLGGPNAPGCALRSTPTPTTLNNVAVPNAEVIDAFSNTDPASNANALTTFILGGRTQIEAAEQVQPTFASVWIGNNDVLDGALSGDTTLVTPLDSFQSRYSRIVNQLESTNTLEGAVFLGVSDPTLSPHFSSGAAYQQAVPAGQNAGVIPSNFQLSSCSPSESGAVLIPFQHGATLIRTATAVQPISDPSPTITLDCSQDRTVEETVRQSLSQVPEGIVDNVVEEIPETSRPISLLTPPEVSFLKTRVDDFNNHIRNQVNSDYGYVDPNDLLQANSDQIPAFPELVENPATPWSPDQPFGPLFSLDGIHPSSAAHRLIANQIIAAINETYSTEVPDVPAP